ncbi:GNAT family N-acetyltransferase [Ralstonia solanacearum]|uniref:GNAT family N-acetyltransferase n=1 Tax=Ralstonia solanacearum TaxID=305 RepID=UPI0001D9655C|nr:hypothethical protein, acyl-CoA N-acyltransferase domain [Ralstonia solanacearum PSI07]
MRGVDGYTESMFTVAKLDDFVSANHPLRPIRAWLNDALERMDQVFARMYERNAKGGRPSIAPEKLIRALLLRVLYSIRSERMLMEPISYNMLFRGFVGLAMDDTVGDHSTFSKNRDRLLAHEVMVGLFNETVEILAETDEVFLIDNVAVHPSKKGQGIGKALLVQAEREAVAGGHESVYLYTNEKMTENIAMYTKAGFAHFVPPLMSNVDGSSSINTGPSSCG